MVVNTASQWVALLDQFADLDKTVSNLYQGTKDLVISWLPSDRTFAKNNEDGRGNR